ncbi:MAG: hypothetical protein PVJ89_05095, partial [Planctomycetota bacterium]
MRARPPKDVPVGPVLAGPARAMGLVGALRVGAGLVRVCLCACLAACSGGDGSEATGSAAGSDLEGSL